MRVVADIEANGLENPSKIWVICCRDIDTRILYVFRKVSDDDKEKQRFLKFAEGVTLWIGHNWLGYDWPVIANLLGISRPDIALCSIDTLIISKLVDYPRDKHSVEDYGREFGLDKIEFKDFSKYSPEMEKYCIRDVDITEKIYNKYLKFIKNPDRQRSIGYEHQFQYKCVNDLHTNGFAFNSKKATSLLEKVQKELDLLDETIKSVFPPKLRAIREVIPKLTAHGTISKVDFRFVKDGDLSIYNGGPFTRCEWHAFNPSSHKQLIAVLTEAGWVPTEKTKTFVEAERELNQLKREFKGTELDVRLKVLYDKISLLGKFGWKINEKNLDTLPSSAPAPARALAKRILLESRRRTLTEWLGLVSQDGRIHGKFYGIGAWTHRMAHQNPNTANIPNEFDTQGKKKLLGKELRSLWCAPRGRLLTGVDAEGIQLRIFAHYIDDPEFTRALVEGRKEDKSDPHSLNQRILGDACKSRAAAKRFIYALLLGAGIGKLGEILEASKDETESALNRLLGRYRGFAELKSSRIPSDAKRGWFLGLDGRAVRIPGDTSSQRKHLCMSGYLQNGEAVVMKLATLRWLEQLEKEDELSTANGASTKYANGILYVPNGDGSLVPSGISNDKNHAWKIVNMVHDEWQTECSNDLTQALHIAKVQSDALVWAGEQLNLKCPMAGSYWNDDIKDYTISTNWSLTH